MRLGILELSFEELVRLESLPDLEYMRSGGQTVLYLQSLAAKTGENIVGEVLRDADSFVEWQHYPDEDVYDPEYFCQYYYHAHPAEQRFDAEHGHFHLFMRGSGVPENVQPAPGQSLPAEREDILCHLVAISMNAHGRPFRLFTINRWVTGDVWYAAPDAIAMIARFKVDILRPNLAVNAWITAIVQFYRPQIAALLLARDKVLDDLRSTKKSEDKFEDRELEVLTQMDIDPERDLGIVDQAIHLVRSSQGPRK